MSVSVGSHPLHSHNPPPSSHWHRPCQGPPRNVIRHWVKYNLPNKNKDMIFLRLSKFIQIQFGKYKFQNIN